LITVDPVVSVGSVHVAAASPLRVRAALIAVRSSLVCVAFSMVVPATSGLSVKPPLTLVAKLAATVAAALMVTLQAPVPVHAPLQPVKVEPVPGVAVNTTIVPVVNEAAHVAPQAMPAGALVTAPVPVPDLVTVRAKEDGRVNVAMTEVAALSVMVQAAVPEHPPPLQPENVEPVAGVAVKVAMVPVVNCVEQVAPHEIPAGALRTVPLPVPDGVTVSAKDDCTKLAVTDVAALIVTVQGPVPVQPPPLQPENVEPAAGVAVKVTAVPLANAAEQVAPQEMPAGAVETVPVPAPAFVTESVKG
jgi:hypothetical protein